MFKRPVDYSAGLFYCPIVKRMDVLFYKSGCVLCGEGWGVDKREVRPVTATGGLSELPVPLKNLIGIKYGCCKYLYSIRKKIS